MDVIGNNEKDHICPFRYFRTKQSLIHINFLQALVATKQL